MPCITQSHYFNNLSINVNLIFVESTLSTVINDTSTFTSWAYGFVLDWRHCVMNAELNAHNSFPLFIQYSSFSYSFDFQSDQYLHYLCVYVNILFIYNNNKKITIHSQYRLPDKTFLKYMKAFDSFWTITWKIKWLLGCMKTSFWPIAYQLQ